MRLAVNVDSLATRMMPALAAFRGMPFDPVTEDQDAFAERLRRGEVAAVITADAGPVPGCDAVPLGALRHRAAASPRVCRALVPAGGDGCGAAAGTRPAVR